MYNNAYFNTKYISSLDFGSYGGSTPPTQDPMKAMDQAINWGWQFVELGFGPTGGGGQAFAAGKAGKPSREELARLAKLNKMSMAVHHYTGDDPAGFTGREFNDVAQERAEYNMKTTIDFVDDVAKKMGANNVPVVVHSSAGVPGNPQPDKQIYFADQDSGAVGVVEPERRMRDGKIVWATPDEILQERNDSLIANAASRFSNVTISMDSIWREKEAAKELLREGEREKNADKIRRATRMMEVAEKAFEPVKKEYERSKTEFDRLHKDYMKKGKYNQLIPTNDYAVDRAAETIAKLGHYAYSKKSKPMVCVENLFPEWYGGKPKEMEKLLKKSREMFVKNRPKNMSEGAAKRAANEIIGMTVDVGHMNMWKRYKDSKDFNNLRREFGKLAPYVKHVHLSDNMGDMDAHLPIGWGNAPNKEVMEDMRKAGYKGKVLIEAYGLPEGAHFGVYQSLPHMAPPLYTPGPTWQEAAFSYFFGDYPFTMGPIFPGIHAEQYGMGFSGLPSVMGAKRPGERGRFSGTPMS